MVRPPTGDVALGAGLAGLALVETTTGAFAWMDQWRGEPLVNAVVLVAACLALAWRRAAPIAALVAVLGGLGALSMAYGASQTSVAVFAAAVAIYSAAAYAGSPGLVAALAALGVVVRDTNDPLLHSLGDHLWSPLFAGLAFAAGMVTRRHRRSVLAAEQKNVLLEREQADLVAAVVEEERRRIARELHDVVSHTLGIVVLQAGAGEQVLDQPEKVRAILRSVRASGLEAIGEMSTLLDVIAPDGAQPRHPQPTLADLPALVRNAQGAGVEVSLRTEGAVRALPTAVELSAYRIAQEGLTNALKHAAAVSVAVTVRYSDQEVEVEVTDDGAGASCAGGGRRGLAGVGERVAVFGGHLAAGPRDAGGWSMRATLPVAR